MQKKKCSTTYYLDYCQWLRVGRYGILPYIGLIKSVTTTSSLSWLRRSFALLSRWSARGPRPLAEDGPPKEQTAKNIVRGTALISKPTKELYSQCLHLPRKCAKGIRVLL